jgi:hypothetical protein
MKLRPNKTFLGAGLITIFFGLTQILSAQTDGEDPKVAPLEAFGGEAAVEPPEPKAPVSEVPV